MIYLILKYLAQLCFVIYHRKVYLLDTDNLPQGGPVLLALNHPGAFLDACVISAYSKRQLYYLTRGDLFKKGIAEWFLTQTHQIPIYRAEDGIKNLRSNRSAFEACFRHLAEDHCVLIFPEARTALEKRLRPLHKGAARIVFGANERFPDKMPVILPVGVTFSEPREFKRDAFLKYGKPISIEMLIKDYQNDPQAALSALTEQLRGALAENMIYLEDARREKAFDAAVILLEQDPPAFPPVSDDLGVFNWQRALSQRLNALSDTDLTQAEDLLKTVKSKLKRNDIKFHHYPIFEDKRIGGFWYIFSAIPFYTGRLVEWLPAFLTHQFAVSKVKNLPFIGPIKSMIGFFIHAFIYLIYTIILVVAFGGIGWLIGLLVLMLGYFSLAEHRKPHIFELMKWSGVSDSTKDELKQLRTQLKSLLDA